MYTYCIIQFVGDDSTMDVIIKSNTEMDKNDDRIFFYGLPRERLIKAREENEVLEGEWRVLAVCETFNIFPNYCF